LDEACFSNNELDFANNEHTVLFKDGPKRIPATIVTEGSGRGSG
jgi:hypothetical protein